ncbi:unnamed protein product [Paramecium sonneborni]|uniref:Protein kinase domain-containing protein n=1 Tax=Paramecium sonneborni TaxID=65129 RepID=A0A8S1NXG2_9CILI|nr:unnamed protein product [Paramecium sonneborni]
MACFTKPPNLAIATEFIQGGSLYHLLHKTKQRKTDQLVIKSQIDQNILLLYIETQNLTIYYCKDKYQIKDINNLVGLQHTWFQNYLLKDQIPWDCLEMQEIIQKTIKNEQLPIRNVPKNIVQLVNELRNKYETKRPSMDLVVKQLLNR